MHDSYRDEGSDKPSHGPISGSSDRAYQRLDHLYAISKYLTKKIDSVDKTFLEILTLAEGVFPMWSTVLVDKKGRSPQVAIWSPSNLNSERIDKAIANARTSFVYLVGLTPSEETVLNAESVTISSIPERSFTSSTMNENADNFLVFPLVVERIPIFGVLQFGVSKFLDEEDLKFANALANLIALALDRYHGVQERREAAENGERAIRAERDDSRRLVAELEEERGLREKFVQMLSHDLRTPLAVVSMTAQLLALSKSLQPPDLELVKKLTVNANRLNRMIDGLLDANRLKAGEKLPLTIEECDLGLIAKEAIDELNEFAGGQIEYDGPEKVKGYWGGDALRRLAENLIGNAIKYRQPETPILVSLRDVGAGWIFSVHNSGAPISRQDQTTLFDQFRRAGSAQRGGKTGWGLGLTLVRGISEAHGGKVWVESNNEEGTTFSVQIPYDSRPANQLVIL